MSRDTSMIYIAPLSEVVEGELYFQYKAESLHQLKNMLCHILLQKNAEFNMPAAVNENGQIIVFDSKKSFRKYKKRFLGEPNNLFAI
jgi:hypothetical protein